MVLFKAGHLFKGQQLSEYTIIIALVAVVVTGGLTMMGSSIKDALGSLFGGFTSPSQSSLVANVQNSSNNALPIVNQPQKPLVSPGLSQSTNMIAVTANVASMVETTGANGATNLLASQILGTGKEELAKGNITQEQYSLFEQLANKGHQMAEVEGMIEAAASKVSTYDELMNTSVIYKGQQMTIGKLTDYMGTNNKWNGNPLDYANEPSDTLKEFIDAYNALDQSGGLKDSNIKSQVTTLSNRIGQLNNDFDNARIALQNQSNYSVASLQQVGATSLSNLKSAKICTTGSGSDNGTTCK